MALVRKILETTLTAGSTSVTFTDTDIPNSLLRVYCTKASLFPLSQTLSGNVLSVNYKAQSENVGVALEIVKQGLDIVDNLTSEDATKALSANQGYVLKGLIDNIVIPTVPDKITDLSDVSVSGITAGQVLAWDAVTEKFVNVDQSGGGSGIIYSNEEQVIGKWYDGSDLYARTFEYINSGISSGSTALVTLDSNINVKRVTGMVHHTSTKRSYTFPYVGSSGSTSLYISDDNKITMLLTAGSWSNSYTPIYLYIEYTKEVTP